jgi:hypothetical protein
VNLPYTKNDLGAGARALAIIEQVIDPLHDQIRQIPWAEDSELARLKDAVPDGPLNLGGTIVAAMDMARGALDHIRQIMMGSDYHPTAVLHPLIRVALVGAARVVTPLQPTDPDERVRNALSVVWRDADGQHQAFNKLKTFRQLGLAPDAQLLAAADTQYKELKRLGADIGEGALIQRMIAAVAAALESDIADAPGLPADHAELASEWAHWLWNIYSGSAHAQSWPRLIPDFYGDGTVVSGNFCGDLMEVAAVTQVGLYAVADRVQPASAGTTAEVDSSIAVSMIK